MPYATRQDIVYREGLDAFTAAADRDRDGVIDETAVTAKLADASSTIDTYLALRYPLPLATVPPVLKRLCVDIALYLLSLSQDALTKELRQRYEDAISLLNKMAAGTVGLGIPANPATPVSGDVKGGEVLLPSSPPRLFSRSTLVDL